MRWVCGLRTNIYSLGYVSRWRVVNSSLIFSLFTLINHNIGITSVLSGVSNVNVTGSPPSAASLPVSNGPYDVEPKSHKSHVPPSPSNSYNRLNTWNGLTAVNCKPTEYDSGRPAHTATSDDNAGDRTSTVGFRSTVPRTYTAVSVMLPSWSTARNLSVSRNRPTCTGSTSTRTVVRFVTRNRSGSTRAQPSLSETHDTSAEPDPPLMKKSTVPSTHESVLVTGKHALQRQIVTFWKCLKLNL